MTRLLSILRGLARLGGDLLALLAALLGVALGYGLDVVWRGPMVRRVKL